MARAPDAGADHEQAQVGKALAVATVLDAAGQTPRAVADQLGHAHISTTQDHYFGRRIANPAAAQALDDWHDQEDLHE